MQEAFVFAPASAPRPPVHPDATSITEDTFAAAAGTRRDFVIELRGVSPKPVSTRVQ